MSVLDEAGRGQDRDGRMRKTLNKQFPAKAINLRRGRLLFRGYCPLDDRLGTDCHGRKRPRNDSFLRGGERVCNPRPGGD